MTRKYSKKTYFHQTLGCLLKFRNFQQITQERKKRKVKTKMLVLGTGFTDVRKHIDLQKTTGRPTKKLNIYTTSFMFLTFPSLNFNQSCIHIRRPKLQSNSKMLFGLNNFAFSNHSKTLQVEQKLQKMRTKTL